MIEFPRRARVESPSEAPAQQTLPAWRIELSERVRAVRARRANSSVEEITSTSSASAGGPGAAAARQREVERVEQPRQVDAQNASSGQTPADPTPRTNDSLVEAALTRVRRAAEPSRRGAVHAKSLVLGDRQGTARALKLEAEAAPLTAEPFSDPEPQHSAEHAEDLATQQLAVADEIDPLDYLEAEVRKVDRALAAEFARNESPPLVSHVVIGLVDLVVIALSAAPFMVLMSSTSGFAGDRSRVAAAMIVALISFFYLVATQALCGKTFGMMLTNTRVVDARTFEPISPGQALARTLGYFVALIPAAIGLLWLLANKKRRGWQDFLSRTLVARDF